MSHLFISYSRLDQKYAKALVEMLKDEFAIWIDDRIDYGEMWPQVIQQKLDEAVAMILVMTPRAFESRWVQSELARAQRKKKPIFPLLLEGERWLSVESIQCVDVSDGRMPPAEFRRLLKKQLGSRSRLDFGAAAKALRARGDQPDFVAAHRALRGEQAAQDDPHRRKVDEVLQALNRVLQHEETWGVGLHEVYATTEKNLGLYLYAEVKDMARLAVYAPKVHEAYERYRDDERIKIERARVAMSRKPDPSDPSSVSNWLRETTAPSENFMGAIAYLRKLGTRLIWYPKSVTEDLTPIAQELLEVNARLGLPLELTGVGKLHNTPRH